MDSLADLVAVVTGAGGGIGAALAAELVRHGCKVALADISRANLDSQSAQLRARGGDVIAIETDVTDPLRVESLAASVESHFGAVHIVCNNAGVLATGPMVDTPEDVWRNVMDVNFWGVVHGIRAFVPRLIRQGKGGYILNTASLAGLQGVGGLGVYGASKFAVVGLSESLRQELKPFGIGVGVLCPMVVKTHLAGRGEDGGPKADKAHEHVPQLKKGTVKTPEFVAAQAAKAILARQFYIFTHEEERRILRERAERLDQACDWMDETMSATQTQS
jgi:NAD(P)-dependent dehydrogenase (short-subunit alcohol dehydrogenase family)